MKRLVMVLLILGAVVFLSAETKGNVQVLKLGDASEFSTVSGIKLPAAFGKKDEYYAVIKITGLKKGNRYQATFNWEGGTDIYFGMTLIDGNPFSKNWRSLGSVGSSTGKGDPLPGYEAYHLFATSPKSRKSAVYLVIRSDNPWTINLSVAPAKPEVNQQTKNSYGFFAVEDWTNNGTVAFELTRN
ncbi:MAG: hypothetical protein JW969_04060 [Spirochaetales bacterium]|nr:hypothetical protein [Spirochaetales bacterium]